MADPLNDDHLYDNMPTKFLCALFIEMGALYSAINRDGEFPTLYLHVEITRVLKVRGVEWCEEICSFVHGGTCVL